MGKRARQVRPGVKEKMLFRVAHLFFWEKRKVSEIADRINTEFHDEIHHPYTRERSIRCWLRCEITTSCG